MKRFLVVTAIFMSACVGASAQDEVREDGPYFRIGGGATFVNDWEQDLAYNPDIISVVTPPSGQVFDNGSGFIAGAALGFDYADGIRTELEYRYASSDIASITPSGGFNPDPMIDPNAPISPSDDLTAHFVLSNFYFDFYNDSPITPFIGGGVGGAFVDAGLGERDAALAYQGRAGLSVALGGGFLADIEYIYLRTNRLDYGPRLEDFTPSGPFGPAITGDRYEASNVMLSLRKPF